MAGTVFMGETPRQRALLDLRELLGPLLEIRRIPDEIEFEDRPLPIADVAEDVSRFRRQGAFFAERGIPQFAALFRRADDAETIGNAEEVPILIEADDLDDLNGTYFETVSALQESGLPIVPLSRGEASLTFLNRLAEFLFMRSGQGQSRPNPSFPHHTVVQSNRNGDRILFANGYFLSTRTVFGISTPAAGSLPADRYSFGILDAAGRPRFENVLWSIPHSSPVRLNLP